MGNEYFCVYLLYVQIYLYQWATCELTRKNYHRLLVTMVWLFRHVVALGKCVFLKHG